MVPTDLSHGLCETARSGWMSGRRAQISCRVVRKAWRHWSSCWTRRPSTGSVVARRRRSWRSRRPAAAARPLANRWTTAAQDSCRRTWWPRPAGHRAPPSPAAHGPRSDCRRCSPARRSRTWPVCGRSTACSPRTAACLPRCSRSRCPRNTPTVLQSDKRKPLLVGVDKYWTLLKLVATEICLRRRSVAFSRPYLSTPVIQCRRHTLEQNRSVKCTVM